MTIRVPALRWPWLVEAGRSGKARRDPPLPKAGEGDHAKHGGGGGASPKSFSCRSPAPLPGFETDGRPLHRLRRSPSPALRAREDLRAIALLAGAACLGFALLGLEIRAARADAFVTRTIVPSEIDPAVKDFDQPNVVILDPSAPPTRPLTVFLSGTRGKPENAMTLLNVIAEQGYRVIGLEYDDIPAVQKVCPRSPDPDCSEAFRAMRVYGHANTAPPVDNPMAEAIVTRLVALLTALDKRYPTEGWGGYLKGGAPDWSRIVVTGLSQGAGMAAFIAKHQLVARAVLFSSPWDFTGPDHTPAPWLSQPSATPSDRWYAEYHKREKTADAIARAYEALHIPSDHILVFDRDLINPDARGNNPYHPSTIKDPGYAPQWRQMFGTAQ